MPIGPIFTNAMLGIDANASKVKTARERRRDTVRSPGFDQILDETELASLEQVEASQATRKVESNRSEDSHEDRLEHGYYTPTGRTLDTEARHRLDLEG